MLDFKRHVTGGSSEAIYEFVEDEKELNGIMGVFEELLEDVEIER